MSCFPFKSCKIRGVDLSVDRRGSIDPHVDLVVRMSLSTGLFFSEALTVYIHRCPSRNFYMMRRGPTDGHFVLHALDLFV